MEIHDDRVDLVDVVAGLDAESTSVLHRAEPLVLHITRPPASDVVLELVGRLRTLPTVSVVVGRFDVVPPELAAATDVCLTSTAGPPRPWVAAPVEPITKAVASQPEAALALVARLRSGGVGSPWDGIVAEAATFAMLVGSDAFGRWRAGRPVRDRPRPEKPPVRLRRAGPVLHIELDRPNVHNAFDILLRDELVSALHLPLADPSITAVHLLGRGPSFSSGGDLDEFGSVGDPATSFAVRLTRHPGYAVHLVAERTTAHLHGACFGAGIEVAAFAGRILAAAPTTFRLPELEMGLIPGAGGTVSLPHRIGRHRTAWLALSGAVIDVPTALDWGLVDCVAGEL